MTKWNVYEKRLIDGTKVWDNIGTVDAETTKRAMDIAKREYDTPLKVEKK